MLEYQNELDYAVITNKTKISVAENKNKRSIFAYEICPSFGREV